MIYRSDSGSGRRPPHTLPRSSIISPVRSTPALDSGKALLEAGPGQRCPYPQARVCQKLIRSDRGNRLQPECLEDQRERIKRSWPESKGLLGATAETAEFCLERGFRQKPSPPNPAGVRDHRRRSLPACTCQKSSFTALC